MDLDKLKSAWNQQQEVIKNNNRSIFALIHNESSGPVARLNRRFRRGMILIPALASLGIVQLSRRPGFMSEVLTWYLLAFCIAMMVYFYLNYRLTSRMQVIEDNVSASLKKQVFLLKYGLKWRLIIMRGLLAGFILITELIIYFNVSPGFGKWQQLNMTVRVSIYAGYFVFFYFLTRFATHYRYKKHILYLESLIEQMQ